jgi:hypothetical protein
MKYAIEMAAGGMMCISRFIKIGLCVQKLLRGIHIQTHTAG